MPIDRKDNPLAVVDHAEAVALFRGEIIGALSRRDLDHGELAAELGVLSQRRYRPPGADATQRYSVATLERWLYKYKAGGLGALRPKVRGDKGRAHALTEAQRALLGDIRREHPNASVPLILRRLVADGRLDQGAVSEATVRRFLVEQCLDRVSLRQSVTSTTRLRWQAERPGALWHGDYGVIGPMWSTKRGATRHARYYEKVFGARILSLGDGNAPGYLQLANIWIILNVGGGPMPDKSTVTLSVPDPNHLSSFMNFRVADIQASYKLWKSRGAEFITEPLDKYGEWRCYIRDPDGYIIEIGQSKPEFKYG